jgi:chorismate mutase
MMLFAKKSALAELETELVGLVRRRARLADKVAAAKTEHESAATAQLKLLAGSDSDDPKAEAVAQRRVDAARSALAALEAALAEIERQHQATEGRLAAEKDQTARHASADAIEGEVRAAEEAISLLSELRKVAHAFQAIGDLSFDCEQIGTYALTAAQEIELAAAFALRDVSAIASQIEQGDRSIPRRRKDQPAPLPSVAPASPTECVFALKSIKWFDDGVVHRACLYSDVNLPPALAARAKSLGAATTMQDPRRAKLRGVNGMFAPALENCIALNDLPATAEPEKRFDPRFEPLPDLRTPYVIATEGPSQ